jgi:hypothetical protein
VSRKGRFSEPHRGGIFVESESPKTKAPYERHQDRTCRPDRAFGRMRSVCYKETAPTELSQNQTSHGDTFDNSFSLNDPVQPDRPKTAFIIWARRAVGRIPDAASSTFARSPCGGCGGAVWGPHGLQGRRKSVRATSLENHHKHLLRPARDPGNQPPRIEPAINTVAQARTERRADVPVRSRLGNQTRFGER